MKIATIGHFVVPTVQLVSLAVDCKVLCLVQLIPVVVLVVVLGTCRTSSLQVVLVVLVVVAIGLDQLLLTSKFPRVVLKCLAVLVEVAEG